MAIDNSRLRQALAQFDSRYEARDAVYKVIYVEEVDDTTHTVDFLTPTGERGVRRNVRGRVAPWPGAQMRVSKDRKAWGPDEWVIIGPDEDAYGTTPGPGTGLIPHGETHDFQGSDQIWNLHTFQLYYPPRAQGNDPIDLNAAIQPGTYYADGGYHQISVVTLEDLTAYVGALAVGQRQFLVLSIDAAGSINVTEGVVVAGTLDSEDIPSPPVNEYVMCAVDIRGGDTSLDHDRFYTDLRFISAAATSVPIWYLLTDGNGDVVSDGNGDVLWEAF